MTNKRLLQLYGYNNDNQFKTTFNKKMSGGNIQNGPPWSSSNRGSQTVRRPGITVNAAKSIGTKNYPIFIYSSIISGIGPHSIGAETR
jgi:hypothetical protein